MERSRDEEEAFDAITSCCYTSEVVRSLERPFMEEGVPLMRMAADAVSAIARSMLAREGMDQSQAGVVLLAGGGDNGGDGLYACADLAARGYDVTCVATGRGLHEGGAQAFQDAGGVIISIDTASNIPSSQAPADVQEARERFAQAVDLAQGADLVIDAMTGIGLKGSLEGIPSAIAAALGQEGGVPESPAMQDGEDRRLPMVLAVDTPSGVGVDDGSLPGPYIPADVTVTMGALKPCLTLPPAAYACGTLVLVDFGFDTRAVAPLARSMTATACAACIRRPRIDDTKYSRTVVGLVTGSDHYRGAALLSSTAAAKANVGMIRYTGPDRAGDLVLASVPEAVLGSGRVESWVLGSGVPTSQALAVQRKGEAGSGSGSEEAQRRTIGEILSREGDEEGTEGSGIPLVVDAGALDLLPDRVRPQVVLTPHAGELASLLTARGESVTADEVTEEPLHWATRAWELTGATVLLKGAITLVVGDDGTGQRQVITSGSGPSWLSTAGSGDVLSGTVGALLAQNADRLADEPTDAVEVTAGAAYLHGLAGVMASGGAPGGWCPPLVLTRPSKDPLLESPLRVGQEDGDGWWQAGGRPILATQVADRLPDAIGALLDAPCPYAAPRPLFDLEDGPFPAESDESEETDGIEDEEGPGEVDPLDMDL